MPSSFTRVLSSALGFSPHPPVSVCGTVSHQLKLSGFSWKLGITNFAPRGSSSSRLDVDDPPDLPRGSAYTLEPGHPTPGFASLLRPRIASPWSAGILTCFPSTTPFGLALGTDSPCADYRCAGNLGFTANGFFTRFIVTHVSIRTSDASRGPRGSSFAGLRNAPLPLTLARESAASVHGLSPVESSAQADSTSELLRFL